MSQIHRAIIDIELKQNPCPNDRRIASYWVYWCGFQQVSERPKINPPRSFHFSVRDSHVVARNHQIPSTPVLKVARMLVGKSCWFLQATNDTECSTKDCWLKMLVGKICLYISVGLANLLNIQLTTDVFRWSWRLRPLRPLVDSWSTSGSTRNLLRSLDPHGLWILTPSPEPLGTQRQSDLLLFDWNLTAQCSRLVARCKQNIV